MMHTAAHASKGQPACRAGQDANQCARRPESPLADLQRTRLFALLDNGARACQSVGLLDSHSQARGQALFAK